MKCILAAVDPASLEQPALKRACRLAVEHGARLHVLGVLEDDRWAQDRTTALQQLHDAFGRRAWCDRADARFDVATGTPSAAIAEKGAEIGADLIIVGGHRHARWADRIFGTTAEALLRDTRIPLLIARDATDRPYRIAVAAAQGDSSVTAAIELAALIGVEALTAVHAYELPFEAQVIGGTVTATIMTEESRAFAERVERLAARTGATLHVDALSFEDDVIFALAQGARAVQADLLILTTHARTGIGWLARGSVTDSAIEHLPGDILIGRLPK
ncbi:MAG: universal stress protein [Sphingomonas sp.]